MVMKFKDFIEIDSAPLTVIISSSVLEEASSTSARYSVEVNYRSTIDEVLKGAAKIILGYVSAAMKQNDYHIKQVYDEMPLRVLVSSRNWDDGEWVGLVSYNPKHNCFVVSKGFYNRDKKTVSLQGDSTRCSGDNAAEIVKELRNKMHSLKSEPDRWQTKLKPVPLKRGPK